MLGFLSALIDADKLGGYVRGLVASGFGVLIARWSWLGTILTPELQNAAAVFVSGVTVGIWSHLVKSDAAKVAMAAAIPAVKKIEVTSMALKTGAAAPEVQLAR